MTMTQDEWEQHERTTLNTVGDLIALLATFPAEAQILVTWEGTVNRVVVGKEISDGAVWIDAEYDRLVNYDENEGWS